MIKLQPEIIMMRIREQREKMCEVWVANADNAVKVLHNRKTGMHYLYADGICLFTAKSRDVIGMHFKAELFKREEI